VLFFNNKRLKYNYYNNYCNKVDKTIQEYMSLYLHSIFYTLRFIILFSELYIFDLDFYIILL